MDNPTSLLSFAPSHSSCSSRTVRAAVCEDFLNYVSLASTSQGVQLKFGMVPRVKKGPAQEGGEKGQLIAERRNAEVSRDVSAMS